MTINPKALENRRIHREPLRGLSNHRGVFRFLKSLNNPSIEMLQSGKYSSCLFAEEQHPSVAAAGVFTTSSLDVNDHAATMYESRS
jgi:hypothetical protein